MKQQSKRLQRGVARRTSIRYYLHCYNYKLDSSHSKKSYISTDLFVLDAVSLDDLYWRLRGQYGLAYGDYVDNEHSKQIGYAFIAEKMGTYTEVEILLQPRVSTWISAYPRFVKESEEIGAITELEREYVPEYKKVDFPLPVIPPIKRRG
jgi:hypothetical protein